MSQRGKHGVEETTYEEGSRRGFKQLLTLKKSTPWGEKKRVNDLYSRRVWQKPEKKILSAAGSRKKSARRSGSR